jgi:hypothetical protein
MAREFTIKVFEGWLINQTEIKTDPRYNKQLGEADDLLVQVNVTEFSGVSPTFVSIYDKSNDNVFGKDENTYTSATITAVFQYFYPITGMVNGGFGWFGFKMGQASTKAYIQVFVTGRSK